MDQFITGPYETSLADDEIVRALRVSKPTPGVRWAYRKFVRQVGEFAKASATVLVDPQSSVPRIAVGALGRQPLVLDEEAARSLHNGQASAIDALAAALPDKAKQDLALHAAMLSRAIEDARDAKSGAAKT